MRLAFFLLTFSVGVNLLGQTSPNLGGIPLQLPDERVGPGAIPLLEPRDATGVPRDSRVIPMREPVDRSTSPAHSGIAEYYRTQPEPAYWGYYPTWQPSEAYPLTGQARYASYGLYYPGAVYADPYATGSREHLNNLYSLSPVVPYDVVVRGDYGDTTFDVRPFRDNFNPGAAEVKLGPFYLDVKSAHLTGLYTDISGPFADRLPDDGFIMALGLTVEALLQLSRDTYLSATATAYWLPLEGEVGFLMGTDTNIYLQHKMELGAWDIMIYDLFDVYTPIDSLAYGTDDEAARAGRYALGSGAFVDRPFSDDYLSYRNMVGVNAGTYLARDLRLRLTAQHWDIWDRDFHHTTQVDHGGLGIYYNPTDLWFLPYATYDAYFIDGQFDDPIQVARVGATFPISRILTGYGSVGYAWRDVNEDVSRETVVWNVGVTHRITSQLSHSADVGYNYMLGDLAEEFMGYHARYSINYTAGNGFTLGSFAQFTSNDLENSTDAYLVGAYSRFPIDRRTSAILSVYYTDQSSDVIDLTSWIYQAQIRRSLARTVDANLTYRFTDFNSTAGANSFNESLLMLNITKRF